MQELLPVCAAQISGNAEEVVQEAEEHAARRMDRRQPDLVGVWPCSHTAQLPGATALRNMKVKSGFEPLVPLCFPRAAGEVGEVECSGMPVY